MTEGFWPAGYDRYGAGASGPRVPAYRRALDSILPLVAYMIHKPPAPQRRTRAVDACLRTHVRVRRLAGWAIHEVVGRSRSHVRTACGQLLALTEIVFTDLDADCAHRGANGCSVRLGRKAERPDPVDRPDGAYQCGAANNKSRRDATSNSVGIRPDRDSFRSVKNAADNHVNAPRIADEVATASTPRGVGNNSPVQARSRRPHGP